MKKIALIALLMLGTVSAHAVPNVWNGYYRQGSTFYNISGEDKEELHVGCSISSDGKPSGHYVFVKYKGNKIENNIHKKPLSFYIDNKIGVTPVPHSSTYDNEVDWTKLTNALPIAKKIEVYNNNKLLFILKPRNSDETQDLPECTL